MTHPHKSFLDEFAISINKLVPLTPPELIEEAKKLHAELSEDENSTEKQIHQALTLIGRKEFPYRKAYNEICASDEEQRLQELVLDRLDEGLAERVRKIIELGVIFDEYVKSTFFEDDLSGEERYQIEQAVLLADEVLDSQCDDRAKKRQDSFKDLVAKWTKEANRIQAMIDRLRALGEEDPQWSGEINSIASRLEEGWSIVERDPDEDEIMKEIEYWNTVLHEGEEEGV